MELEKVGEAHYVLYFDADCNMGEIDIEATASGLALGGVVLTWEEVDRLREEVEVDDTQGN